ncbi:MAG: GNAT family N-acetyltransferase [Candidatus Hodarchaeota archaeon]
MLWYIKKNILSFQSTFVVKYELSQLVNEPCSCPVLINGSKFYPKRLFEISPEYQARIEEVFTDMDHRPLFDISEAKHRLENGFFFIILENDSEILGWSWAAVNRVYFKDFNCFLPIKEKTAFSFNTYVKKQFRGRRLNQLIVHEKLLHLKKAGYDYIWGLIYPWNHSSIKSFTRMNWEIIGKYYFMKFFFMNLRFPPKSI